MANAKAKTESPKTVAEIQSLKESNRKQLAEGKRDAQQFVAVDKELDRQLAEAIAREAAAKAGSGKLSISAEYWTPKDSTEAKPMVNVSGVGKPFSKGAGVYQSLLSEAGIVGIYNALTELGFTMDVEGIEKALATVKGS